MSDIDKQLRFDVAAACRILAEHGLDFGPAGHISAHVPGRDELFVTPFGVLFDEMLPSDVMRVDLEGNILDGKHRFHPGAVIHLALHRARKNIGAAVHTHAPYSRVLAIKGVEIEPFDQPASSIYGDQAIYRDFTGPVRSVEEAMPIAEALGDKHVLILKNHGLITVGERIRDATWDMLISEWAAETHYKALQIGIERADPLPPEYIEKSRREVRGEHYAPMWEIYLRRLKKSAPDLFDDPAGEPSA